VTGNVSVVHSSGNDSIRSLTSQNALTLSGGSLSIAADSALGSAFTPSGGTLTSSGSVTVTGPMSWTGGAISGRGKSNLAAGAMLSLSGGNEKKLDGHTLANAGTVTWGGTGSLRADNTSVVSNQGGGLFELQSDQALFLGSGSRPAFDNQAGATLRKSAGT